MVKLQVYITNNCWSCEESRRIVAEFQPQFPAINMELLDINVTPRPDNVFAIPTYVLNGRVIYMGNPRRDQLKEKLEQELSNQPV